MNDKYKEQFLRAINDWVCTPYSIDIRYIARKSESSTYLAGALILLTPLPPREDLEFNIDTNEICAGLIQLSDQKKETLLRILSDAANGRLEVNGNYFSLLAKDSYSYHSDMHHGDRWYSELHLQCIGDRDPLSIFHIDSCNLDHSIRKCTPPFDGLADLTGWLGLKNTLQTHEQSTIEIRVLPPVELIISDSRLNNGNLELLLYAHQDFDLSRLGLAVRAVPGIGIQSRLQVASKIKWKQPKNGRREGSIKIRLKNANSALAMLMISETTFRRQWFLDPTKSDNNRLVATQLFDIELRQLRNAIFESGDSTRFEMGISALLFLMGFSPAVQLEKDSPDIIVTTPGGRLVLVECTMRIADFSSKLGKLVDRKNLLSKVMQDSKSPSRVDGVLVCALPKDQIASRPDELQTHQIILITKEDLQLAIDRLRFHSNPDALIDDAIAKMARKIS